MAYLEGNIPEPLFPLMVRNRNSPIAHLRGGPSPKRMDGYLLFEAHRKLRLRSPSASKLGLKPPSNIPSSIEANSMGPNHKRAETDLIARFLPEEVKEAVLIRERDSPQPMRYDLIRKAEEAILQRRQRSFGNLRIAEGIPFSVTPERLVPMMKQNVEPTIFTEPTDSNEIRETAKSSSAQNMVPQSASKKKLTGTPSLLGKDLFTPTRETNGKKLQLFRRSNPKSDLPEVSDFKTEVAQPTRQHSEEKEKEQISPNLAKRSESLLRERRANKFGKLPEIRLNNQQIHEFFQIRRESRSIGNPDDLSRIKRSDGLSSYEADLDQVSNHEPSNLASFVTKMGPSAGVLPAMLCSTDKLLKPSVDKNLLSLPTRSTDAESSRLITSKASTPTFIPDQTPVQCRYYLDSLFKYSKAPNDIEYFNKAFREHYMQTHQALAYCKYLKPVDPRLLNQKKVSLPMRDTDVGKKTLIFDLDETLVHCIDPGHFADAIVKIAFPDGSQVEAGINIRPHALDCLADLAECFEIMVFTASHSAYANAVIDYLDPAGVLIQHRLYREHCILTPEGLYVKDLRILANRDLKNVILVDNAAHSYGYQLENGIPIVPYFDNKKDSELALLARFLKELADVDDVRIHLRKIFKLGVLQLCSTPSLGLFRLFPNYLKKQ